MKLRIFASLLLTFTVVAFSSVAQPTFIKIKGSDTMLPLGVKIADAFMDIHPEYFISVEGGGSQLGIEELEHKEIDISQSSRSLKGMEKNSFKKEKIKLEKLIIGHDALAIIVHRNVGVTQITREQLEGIYTGQLTNWKELGGNDIKIIPFNRNTHSGTNDFFKEMVLNDKDYATDLVELPNTKSIADAIKRIEGTIAFVGIAYVPSNAIVLKISFDKGQSYVEPSDENVQSKNYPISRPLFWLYNANNKEKLHSLLDYALSLNGQMKIKESGFIPVR